MRVKRSELNVKPNKVVNPTRESVAALRGYLGCRAGYHGRYL